MSIISASPSLYQFTPQSPHPSHPAFLTHPPLHFTGSSVSHFLRPISPCIHRSLCIRVHPGMHLSYQANPLQSPISPTHLSLHRSLSTQPFIQQSHLPIPARSLHPTTPPEPPRSNNFPRKEVNETLLLPKPHEILPNTGTPCNSSSKLHLLFFLPCPSFPTVLQLGETLASRQEKTTGLTLASNLQDANHVTNHAPLSLLCSRPSFEP